MFNIKWAGCIRNLEIGLVINLHERDRKTGKLISIISRNTEATNKKNKKDGSVIVVLNC